MPQEFHVVRCFSCAVFQVHQVKKVNKWGCKMCGNKQSLKQEFGRGSGKECRLHVQKLNSARQEVDRCEGVDSEGWRGGGNTLYTSGLHSNAHHKPVLGAVGSGTGLSKWSEFVEGKEETVEEEEDMNITYKLDSHTRRKIKNQPKKRDRNAADFDISHTMKNKWKRSSYDSEIPTEPVFADVTSNDKLGNGQHQGTRRIEASVSPQDGSVYNREQSCNSLEIHESKTTPASYSGSECGKENKWSKFTIACEEEDDLDDLVNY